MRKMIAAALLLLAACSQQEMLQKFSTPEDQAVARAYIDDLRGGRLDPIEAAADASIQGPNLHQTLLRMAEMFPAGEPVAVTLVGASRVHMSSFSDNTDKTTVNSTFEYDFGGKWVLVNVVVQDKGGTKTITGFHVQPQALSLEQQNRFTLSGKSAYHYAVLAGAVAAAALSLYALVLCIRTPLRRRKWLWILFIVLGFGKVSVNWATGQWGVMPLAVQLFSASAMAQFYGPWIVSFSLPIGAVLFLIRRRDLAREAVGEPPPVAPT